MVRNCAAGFLLGLAAFSFEWAAVAAPAPRIPASFYGQWATDIKYCNFEGDDLDSRIWIRADRVSYHDESWPIKSIRRLSSRAISLTYGPSGAEQDDLVPPAQLTLSSDKQLLNAVWRRCVGGTDPK
jgi:hypothetical protein